MVAFAYADDNEAIMLLDIETVLATIVGIDNDLESEAMISAAGKGAGRHILVVDDSRTAIAMLQSILDKLGFSNSAMQSAQQALDYLEQKDTHVDLIISDIEMPGMDGFTFTRTIRESSNLKHHKLLLHSSMSNPSNRLKAEESGANDFVAKFDPDILAERILHLLDN